jgi:CRISPR/Cas system CSM-associated protein Csm2 small subunit
VCDTSHLNEAAQPTHTPTPPPAQGDKRQLSKVRRTLLHTLDEVLRKLDALDDKHQKEPASTKKLKQGDACWATRKLVLGWIINTSLLTLELPQHRKDRLQAILNEVPQRKKRTSVKKWQQIVGEFCSMAIAIPGSRGLFSLLQEALQHQSDGHIHLLHGVHDTLDDL